MVIYKSLAEEDIKKLAEDIYKGLIFTDRHINNPGDVSRVFMPLALLKKEEIEEFNAKPPGMIYEYIDKAGPMALNGMPTFFSFRFLNQEDAKKVNEKYIQIINAIEKI